MPPRPESTSASKPSQPGGVADLLRQLWWTFTVASVAALAVIYSARPDVLAGMTVFPIWVWGLGPLFVSFLGTLRKKRPLGLAFLLWLILLTMYVDSPQAWVRGVVHPAPQERTETRPGYLRVITINIHHNTLALRDLVRYEPDLILVQETVSEQELIDVAGSLFDDGGHVLWNRDCALISRYPLERVELDKVLRGNALSAIAQLPEADGGQRICVNVVHAYSQPFRFDMHKPEFWTAYYDRRLLQLKLMETITRDIPNVDQFDAYLVGGDFNAPPGDAIFSRLPKQLEDTFSRCGVGWGRTIANDLPLIRIDQLWVNQQLTPLTCAAFPSAGSDHRGVVADYLIEDAIGLDATP